MSTNQKILYLLPDVAYLADLVPAKQAGQFSIASFKQFNGQLYQGQKFNQANLTKLLGKLEPDSYQLVLADDFFTNTIVNLKASSEAEVKAQIQEEVLADLKVNEEADDIQTFVLTEFKGTFKVQLSILSRAVLEPLRQALTDTEIKIKKIYPLSWTVKSLISLEPSLSLLQLGGRLYLAKHYIGVDQPVDDEVDSWERLAEAAKTLKGAEPSIQTLYLLANELIFSKFQQKLADVLPVQQLAMPTADDEQLPSYVAKVIEAGARSISIADFQVPGFKLGKAGEIPSSAKKASGKAGETQPLASTDDDELPADDQAADESAADQSTLALPKPELKTIGQAAVASAAVTATQKIDLGESTEIGTSAQSTAAEPQKEAPAESSSNSKTDDKTDSPAAKDQELEADFRAEPAVAETTVSLSTLKVSQSVTTAEDKEELEPKDDSVATESKNQDQPAKAKESAKPTSAPRFAPPPASDEEVDVDLAQFVSHELAKPEATKTTVTQSVTPAAAAKPAAKKIVKNNDGLSNFLKIVFIGLASFSATVAIGVGIGLGVLQLAKTKDNGDSQVALATPTPTVQPSPSPTPLPTVDRSKYKLKIVNATTKAGYAGQFKTKLEAAGFAKVDAKNAAGDYEPGYYLLMATKDDALLKTVSSDLDLELEFSDQAKVEDASGAYQAILVLAK